MDIIVNNVKVTLTPEQIAQIKNTPDLSAEEWLKKYLTNTFTSRFNTNHDIVWYLGDQWIFLQDNKTKEFWVYYYAAWSIFEKEYDMEYVDIQDLYRRVVLEPYGLAY